ncbi:MAG TPA: patatin-like phospholipase family protein [Verrucomicrobiae bacterium]|nr:patatin-like phospholipase family protein [Verrucomicrobiae bacterium]
MRTSFIVFSLALMGCATAPMEPRPINLPVRAESPPLSQEMDFDGDVLVLAFSGGGARAAAFSLGALQGLRDTQGADGQPLLERVRLISSVSGGSITAAYFGQNGAEGLDSFRAAYLDKDWADALHVSPYSPLNWARASRGGVNDQTRLADWLDREVFAHGLVRDVWNENGVRVWLNATDLYNGTTFAFTPLYFDALCSELGSVRIADAVAASMAVPVVFRPVLAAPYPNHCAPMQAWGVGNEYELVRRTAQAFATYRDPQQQSYLHLVDGGVLDNLGLTSLSLARETAGTPYGPLSPRAAVRVRRMTFLVINSEKVRTSEWQLSPEGPSGVQIADALGDIFIESPNRSAYDTFRMIVADWEHDLRTYRCGLSREDIRRLRGDLEGWDCADIHLDLDMLSFNEFDEPTRTQLGQTPTRVTIPPEQTDALIAAGARGVRDNPTVQAFARP